MKVICVLILLRGIFGFSVFLDFGCMGGQILVFMLVIMIRFLALEIHTRTAIFS
jgi:hypothetical protein